MLSADEKPGIQARMRIHPPVPPWPRRAMRAENEYARCGTRRHLVQKAREEGVGRVLVSGRVHAATNGTGYGNNWVIAAVVVRLPVVRRLVAIRCWVTGHQVHEFASQLWPARRMMQMLAEALPGRVMHVVADSPWRVMRNSP